MTPYQNGRIKHKAGIKLEIADPGGLQKGGF
jgi:hypothetical protein